MIQDFEWSLNMSILFFKTMNFYTARLQLCSNNLYLNTITNTSTIAVVSRLLSLIRKNVTQSSDKKLKKSYSKQIIWTQKFSEENSWISGIVRKKLLGERRIGFPLRRFEQISENKSPKIDIFFFQITAGNSKNVKKILEYFDPFTWERLGLF